MLIVKYTLAKANSFPNFNNPRLKPWVKKLHLIVGFSQSIIFLILFCFVVNMCLAQPNDDIPDYRSKRDNFTKMQEKDVRADLSQFTFAGISESLTKHKLTEVLVKNINNSEVDFDNDTIQVQIKTGGFDATKHKVTWFDDKYAVKLDNHPFWGTENKPPTTSIASVIAIIYGDTVVIPPVAYNDLYQPKLFFNDAKGSTKSYCNVYESANHRNYYIYMLNGDGTGRYEVTWVIQDKHYLRRIVDWGF